MLTQLTSLQNSQHMYVREGWRALLALASSSIAVLSAAAVVWADLSIRLGRWPIFSGSIVVVLGLYLAFAALSFPVLPRPSVRAIGERLGYIVVPTIGAAIPAIVTGISIGLDHATVIARLGLVITAMFIGLGVRLRRSPPLLRGEAPLWLRVLDTVRQCVLMAMVAFAMLLYVSASNLVVTTP